MKVLLQGAWARGLCVLALGVLLVAYADRLPEWMVAACGLLFVVLGGVAAVGWLRDRRDAERPAAFYPLAGLGSVLFGLVLVAFPAYFVKALMYLLSAMLLVGGASQCYSLWDARRRGACLHGAFFAAPVVVLGAGLYVLLRPMEGAALPFVVVGAACVLYALMELWTAFVLWRMGCKAAAAPGAEVAVLPPTRDADGEGTTDEGEK